MPLKHHQKEMNVVGNPLRVCAPARINIDINYAISTKKLKFRQKFFTRGMAADTPLASSKEGESSPSLKGVAVISMNNAGCTGIATPFYS